MLTVTQEFSLPKPLCGSQHLRHDYVHMGDGTIQLDLVSYECGAEGTS